MFKFLHSLDTNKLIKSLVVLVIIAIVIILTTFIIYFISFHNSLSSSQNVWGVFGDFIGGTLNPILSFFMLIAIVLTLVVQNKEMQLTREELEKSAEALVHQKAISAKQVEHFELQAKKEDVYRTIKEVYSEILAQINSQKKLYFDSGVSRKIVSDVFGMESKDVLYKNIIPLSSDNDNCKGFDNIDSLQQLIGLFEELKTYLTQYSNLSQNNSIVYYYSKRVYAYVFGFYDKKYIHQDIYEYYQKNIDEFLGSNQL